MVGKRNWLYFSFLGVQNILRRFKSNDVFDEKI